MRRTEILPRNNWQKEVEKIGFGFHTTNVPYWFESAYYSFSMDEIDKLEAATNDLWLMCLDAVQYVIDQHLYHRFSIPEFYVHLIEHSWEKDHPSIYGRFDLCYRDGQIKLLEFNADTPTSLFEASIVQWYWLQDFHPSMDQFNSIHEALIGTWSYLHPYLNQGKLYFSCAKRNLEDLTTTEYLRDCAIQAGIETDFIFIDDLGVKDNSVFVDMNAHEINNIFKLYPYEFMFQEDFGKHLYSKTLWIEPSWKAILSNKAILPILWELFPHHPYLLPAYFDSPGTLTDYVKKPLLSREGANITLVENNKITEHNRGNYGAEGYVYQALFKLPNFDGNHAVIGSWVVGQEAVGIGIRESNGLISNDGSRFVPHLITSFTQ